MCNSVCPYVLDFYLAHHPSVFPHTFDIYRHSLQYLVDLLNSSNQCDNKLKCKYTPQSSLQYRFTYDTCYLYHVLPNTEKEFLKGRIHVWRTIGISRDVPNGILSFWWPGSFLQPTISSFGYYPI